MLLAVHLDGWMLGWPWLAGGYLLAALLTAAAAWRVRDEEVPRIALLTAVFFVAATIHVKIGPTPVHLLLAGLLGAVLGRRAPLAVVVGVGLQAAVGHGGFAALGVNACVMGLPALAAGALFGGLHRLPWLRRPWFRASLVAAGAVVWLLSLVFGVALLCTNPLTAAVRPNVGFGFHLNLPDLGPAWRATLHPVTLVGAVVLAGLAVWAERRLGAAPEFPVGFLLGVFGVLATAALYGLVLLLGGLDRFDTVVEVAFLAHLPLAVVEGVIVGYVVGFLARVKPEVLGLTPQDVLTVPLPEAGSPAPVATPRPTTVQAPPAMRLPLWPLAAAALLLAPGTAFAHRLEAECKVLPGKKVEVESWFETGDAPKKATVKVVRRSDGGTVAEGPLDEQTGKFVFSYEREEPLLVIVTAPGDHRTEVPLFDGQTRRAEGLHVAEVLAGLALVLALGAFVLVWRLQRTVERLRGEVAALRADAAPFRPPSGGEAVRQR
jgi:cobalt/nickel transport system permease protein